MAGACSAVRDVSAYHKAVLVSRALLQVTGGDEDIAAIGALHQIYNIDALVTPTDLRTMGFNERVVSATVSLAWEGFLTYDEHLKEMATSPLHALVTLCVLAVEVGEAGPRTSQKDLRIARLVRFQELSKDVFK